MTPTRRVLTATVLVPLLLLVLAVPSHAATRYVRDGSFIDWRGHRVCLFVLQVKTWRTLWLWDSRGLPRIGRC